MASTFAIGKASELFSVDLIDCVLGHGWSIHSREFHEPGVEMSIGLGLIAALSKSWNCLVLMAFMIVFL